MRRLPLCKVLFLSSFLFVAIFIYCFLSYNSYDSITLKTENLGSLHKSSNKLLTSSKLHSGKIVLSFVVCDSRFNESLNVVKSALLFTKSPLHFVIFADDGLRPLLNDTLSRWKTVINHQLEFELHNINFPKAHEKDWLNLFSKCAAQRLFIPQLITHHEALIYVDIDSLFLGPVEELWAQFHKLNSTQMSAMSLEHESPNLSWYPRFAQHPFYGKLGLNSGVMLMNLTRMRDFGWTEYVTPIMVKWKLYIPFGDQDIINIIFHYHPEAVAQISCRYNFRPDQCMYGDACHDATKHGIFLLHGSRKSFTSDKQPAFKAIYRAINEYQVGLDPTIVLTKMDKYLTEAPQSSCGSIKDAFLKVSTKTLREMFAKPVR